MSDKQSRNHGPVGKALMKHWNKLHDLEYDLKQAGQAYDVASSYSGGPAVKEAQKLMRDIDNAVKALEKVSTGSSSVLSKLMDSEAKFMKAHGDPGDYAEEQSRQMFPRAASDDTHLRKALIRLAYAKPEFREHLLPLVK